MNVNDKEHVDDVYQKREILNENRRKIREMLGKQILLKQENKLAAKDFDNMYVRIQNEKNIEYDKNLLEKKQEKIKEIQKLNMMRDNLIKCTLTLI